MKYLNILSKLVRANDMFQHDLELNLTSKKGPQHATIFGGVVSLLIKACMLGYFVILLVRMVNNDDDKLESY